MEPTLRVEPHFLSTLSILAKLLKQLVEVAIIITSGQSSSHLIIYVRFQPFCKLQMYRQFQHR